MHLQKKIASFWAFLSILLRTSLCPSSLCQEEQAPFCYGHFCVRRASVKKKGTILLRTRLSSSSLCQKEKAPFCYGHLGVHRAYVKKETRHLVTDMFVFFEPRSRRKGAILLQAALWSSSLYQEEEAPLCYEHLCRSSLCQEEEAPFCCGHFCAHRAYVKKKRRHFVTDTFVFVEPMSRRRGAILLRTSLRSSFTKALGTLLI